MDTDSHIKHRKRSRETLVFGLEKVVERNGKFITMPIKETKDGETKIIATNNSFCISRRNRKRQKTSRDTQTYESELLLTRAITPILRRNGVKINSNLTSFQFNLKSVNITVGRTQMLECMRRIQPLIQMYGNHAIDGSMDETIIENLVMEDILISRNLRYIEMEDQVKTTLINFSGQNVRPVSRQQPMQKATNRQPMQNATINDGINYIKIQQLVPKFILNKNDQIVTHKLLKEVKEKAFKKMLRKPATAKQRNLMQINLIDRENDPHSLIVEIKGKEDLVQGARSFLLNRIKSVIATHNIKKILSDKKSFEVDLILDAGGLFGGTFVSQYLESQLNPNMSGVWLERSNNTNGQFEAILGSTLLKGVVLSKLKLDRWINLYTKKDKNSALKEATNRREKNIVAKVYLTKYADLNDIDASFISDTGIRHRDGTKVTSWRPTGTRKKSLELSAKNNASNTNQTGKTEMLQRKSTEKAATSKLATKQNPRKTDRKRFNEKMVDVQNIEFSYFKIPKRKIAFEMWKVHKDLVGEKCNNSCNCSSMIPKLTKNVIRAHIRDEMQMNKNWSNPCDLKETDSMVGFATNFFTKFYSKLCTNYPDDLPHQTLQRLVTIWKLHTKQRRFGLQCFEGCSCIESWETFLPASKISLTESKNPVQEEKVLQGTKKQSTAQKFEVGINPSKTSFGLFFVDQDSKCVIASVDPKGYMKRKVSELQCGFVVHGIAEDNNEMKTVNSWKELEHSYNMLKLDGRRMKIWFSESTVNDTNAPGNNTTEWTSNGGWLGRTFHNNGWAGGSAVVSVRTNQDRTQYKPVHQNTGASAQKNENKSIGSTYLHNMKNSTLVSIFRKEKIASNKQVIIDERKNDIFIIEGRTNTAAKKRNISKEAIIEAALSPRQSIDKFIQCLKQSPSTKSDFESLSESMQLSIERLREHRRAAENQSDFDSIDSNLIVLKLKKMALLVFENAGDVIDLSLGLYDAIQLNIQPLKAQIRLKKTGEINNFENYVFLTLQVRRETIGTSERKAYIKDRIDYPLSGSLRTICSPEELNVYFGEDHSVIELRKGNPLGENIVLTQLPIDLCKMITNVQETSPYQLPSSDYLHEGSLELYISTDTVSIEKMNIKRIEIVQKMKGLIFSINRFRAMSCKYDSTIDTDISSFGNIYLLHAAVSCCDKNMLRDLLRMGANTACFSEKLGTPIDYARTMVKKRDLFKMKYHEMIQVLDEADAEKRDLFKMKDHEMIQVLDEADAEDPCLL